MECDKCFQFDLVPAPWELIHLCQDINEVFTHPAQKYREAEKNWDKDLDFKPELTEPLYVNSKETFFLLCSHMLRC